MRGRPPRPTGSTPEAIYDGHIWDAVYLGLQFHDSSTVKWSVRSNGITAAAKQGTSGASASTAFSPYVFVQSFADYNVVTPLGGTSFTRVAKPFWLRNSIAVATIYGQGIAYNYPHNPAGGGPSADPLAYLYRLATVPGINDVECQGVFPQYVPAGNVVYQSSNAGNNAILTGSLIWAFPQTGLNIAVDPLDPYAGGATVPGAAVALQEIEGRHWMAFADQTFGR